MVPSWMVVVVTASGARLVAVTALFARVVLVTEPGARLVVVTMASLREPSGLWDAAR